MCKVRSFYVKNKSRKGTDYCTIFVENSWLFARVIIIIIIIKYIYIAQDREDAANAFAVFYILSAYTVLATGADCGHSSVSQCTHNRLLSKENRPACLTFNCKNWLQHSKWIRNESATTNYWISSINDVNYLQWINKQVYTLI